MILQQDEILLVRVPAEVGDAEALGEVLPRHVDEPHAALDELPADEAALAEQRPPVAVAQLRRLAVQVEGRAQRRGRQRVEGSGAGALEPRSSALSFGSR